MPEPIEKVVAAAAVVCLKEDSVLLVQRGREPNRGRWSFPGGKISPAETARAAAARETLEETGLSVRVLDVVDVYDAIFPPYHFCVADYLAVPEDDGVPVAADDVIDTRWVPFTDVGSYDVTEAMERVLARARWLLSVCDTAPPSLGALSPQPSALSPQPFSVLSRVSRANIVGLYVVTDAVEIARAALAGGASVIQLRDKRRDAGELLPLAREMRALCRSSGALFIVNDRVDLAVAADADGVHLGQTDLPITDARSLLGPDRLIGISVEDEAQVRQAEAGGADYLGVGPIYGTATKTDAGPAVGLDQIRRFREVSALPIVAIGGITLERVPGLRAAGAHAVAVIGAVAAAKDPEAAARALRYAWNDETLPAKRDDAAQ